MVHPVDNHDRDRRVLTIRRLRSTESCEQPRAQVSQLMGTLVCGGPLCEGRHHGSAVETDLVVWESGMGGETFRENRQAGTRETYNFPTDTVDW